MDKRFKWYIGIAGTALVPLVVLFLCQGLIFAYSQDINRVAEAGDQEGLETMLHYRPELIHYKDHVGYTPLHYSALWGPKESVVYLVEKGGDIHARGKLQAMPIHFAAALGDAEMIQYLIDKGADVKAPFGNPEKKTWMSCLDIACMRGNLEAAKLFVAKGADVNRYHGNLSPLELAIRIGNKDLVIFLLQKGASMKQEDNKGKDLLILAKNEDMKVILREHLSK